MKAHLTPVVFATFALSGCVSRAEEGQVPVSANPPAATGNAAVVASAPAPGASSTATTASADNAGSAGNAITPARPDGNASLAAFIEGNMESRFASLPLKGRLPTAPWPSGYWPDSLGGIARRWSRDAVSESVYFAPPPAKAVRSWKRDRLAALSPAEKWDLLRGRYDFPTLHDVRSKSAFLVPDWAGLCDGVALASTVFPEPGAVTLKNPDGVAVPFASSDVKALLAWHVQNAEGRASVRFGARCDANEPRQPSGECADVEPHEFHLALANRIGARGEAVMADLTWDALVWNHVLFDYETRVRERGAPAAFPDLAGDPRAASAEEIVRVSTRVLANTFQVQEHWDPAKVDRKEDEFHYQYWLYLDARGAVTGGRWKSYERPDFLWRPTKTPEVADPTLRALLAASTDKGNKAKSADAVSATR